MKSPRMLKYCAVMAVTDTRKSLEYIQSSTTDDFTTSGCRMGYVILLWHSLSLSLIIFQTYFEERTNTLISV